jgi:hypothetical protein
MNILQRNTGVVPRKSSCTHWPDLIAAEFSCTRATSLSRSAELHGIRQETRPLTKHVQLPPFEAVGTPRGGRVPIYMEAEFKTLPERVDHYLAKREKPSKC